MGFITIKPPPFGRRVLVHWLSIRIGESQIQGDADGIRFGFWLSMHLGLLWGKVLGWRAPTCFFLPPKGALWKGIYPISSHYIRYIRCIWGWFLEYHLKGTTVFPMIVEWVSQALLEFENDRVNCHPKKITRILFTKFLLLWSLNKDPWHFSHS